VADSFSLPPRGIIHVPRADQLVVSWRNGGGTTREVAAEPRGARAGDAFAWRVSIAQVGSNGPFSVFQGVDRTLWLLRGRGMELDIDGRQVRLRQAHERVDFTGEAKVTARLLDGPTEDLNLMVARSRVRAQARVVTLRTGEHAALDGVEPAQHLCLALAGAVDVEGIALAEGDVVWSAAAVASPWSIRARSDGAALIARMAAQ
jgi:hypothetical protein